MEPQLAWGQEVVPVPQAEHDDQEGAEEVLVPL